MSGSTIGILGLGAYVPERIFTNEDWSQYVDTSDEWITSRTGIKRRRFAAEGESTVDFAANAARRALEDAGTEIEEIDEIIVATDTPEVYAPDSAAYLQDRLGARNVPAYDLAGSGCAGFLLALELARSRTTASGNGRPGPSRKILVVGVELISRLMDWQDRTTCVLFGDAAGAAVVGQGEGAIRILSSVAGTDGSKADILKREVGGTRSPFTLQRATNREHLLIEFNGREVFKEAVGRMSEASLQVLELAGLGLDDVALLIPHQANLRILKSVANALKLPFEKVYVNVDEYGNTGSASVPLALTQARQEGRIERGQVVLLAAFGAGFHWAATVLQF
jgi:3-oxoacyl-[acyl-carrier-protein] synthase-3